VIWDAGTYKVRLRCQNNDGWSAWAESATITVAADTRTEYYVNGSTGNDGNDGLTPGAAKLTLDGALAVIGNDSEVICADDTTISVNAITVITESNVYIRRSYDGTNKPVLQLEDGVATAIKFTSDFIIEGFTTANAGSLTKFLDADHNNTDTNAAILKINIGAASDFLSIAGSVGGVLRHDGCLVYDCVQDVQPEDYFVFSASCLRMSILGCTALFGSVAEHTIRLSGGGFGSWHMVDYCDLSYNHSGINKDVLRFTADKFSGCYRTDLRNGSLEIGYGSAAGGSLKDEIRIDCSRFSSITGVSRTERLSILSGSSNVVLASCILYRDNPHGSAVVTSSDAGGSETDIVGLEFIVCSVFNTLGSSSNVPVLGLSDVGSAVVKDWRAIGCLALSEAAHVDATSASIIVANATPDPGTELKQCVVYKNPAVAHILLKDGTNDPTTAAGLNALSYASDNVTADLSIDADGVVTGGTDHEGIVTDIDGAYESITFGAGKTSEIDRTVGAWDAGAVQRDALLVAIPAAGNTAQSRSPAQDYNPFAIYGIHTMGRGAPVAF
jgi:hypothetical protein